MGPGARPGRRGYGFAFSRRIAPEVCRKSSRPLNSEGAGNAGCALHPRSHVRLCIRMLHMSIQGSGEHPTFPAQWLYGLWRDLPGETASIATVAPRKRWLPKDLTPLRAPGPHAFAVRFSHDRPSQLLRPPQPAPRRDDGRRPSEWDGITQTGRDDLPDGESEIFYISGLDTISVNQK